MKKIFVVALVVSIFITLSVKAQTEKGKLFVAGSSQFGLSQGSNKVVYEGDMEEDSKSTFFMLDFQPKIGYTVINNLPIGLWGNFGYSSSKNKDNDYKYLSNSISGGPFIRYYFADLIGLKPYAEGLIGLGLSAYGYKYEDEKWDPNQMFMFTFQLGAGLTYFFNDHLGVDLFLGYSYDNYVDKDYYEGDDSESKVNFISNQFVMQAGIVAMLKCKRQ